MITIHLSPVRSDETPLTASYSAPVLTVNSAEYDLSELPDGATADHSVLGKISRTGEDYELTLRLPHGPNAPESTRFPANIMINENGIINIPEYDKEDV